MCAMPNTDRSWTIRAPSGSSWAGLAVPRREVYPIAFHWTTEKNGGVRELVGAGAVAVATIEPVMSGHLMRRPRVWTFSIPVADPARIGAAEWRHARASWRRRDSRHSRGRGRIMVARGTSGRAHRGAATCATCRLAAQWADRRGRAWDRVTEHHATLDPHEACEMQRAKMNPCFGRTPIATPS